MSSGVRVNVLQHDIKLNLKPQDLEKEELHEEEPIIVEKLPKGQQEPPKSLVHEQPQQKPKHLVKQEQLPLKNFTEVDPRTKVTNDRPSGLVIPEEIQPETPLPPVQYEHQEQPVQQPVQQQPVKEVPRSKALFDSSFSLKQMLIYTGLIASGLVLGINLAKSTEQVKHSNQFLH